MSDNPKSPAITTAATPPLPHLPTEGGIAEAGLIETVPFADALSERYLAYALSTITSRSLPDARDGLKPVHRRLLYAMRELRLYPDSGFKKCARIVGDVMGKFHPHGDQAIYDSLVRLAQDFAVRYPLVDGQGNFGNIDGDNAAAMRYTEARLTWLAEILLGEIDDNTIEFKATYDGEGQEPDVLPAAFPNLLANGASGIAVGMATNIPPHNLGELCDASIALIENPSLTIGELMAHLPGPDFPTGGILYETAETIAHCYQEGKGSLRLRARWQEDKLKGGGYQIIITEIPWQVAKSRLVERLAALAMGKDNPLLDDVRDESAEDLRLVLTPKSRQVSASLLMESLFRQSELEVRVAANFTMLVNRGRTPQRLDFIKALRQWIDHRHEVLIRRTTHRIAAIDLRLEILGGYLIAFLNLDEVIAIIRYDDHPKPALMRRFELTERQAEAILDLRLKSLRKLEEMEIRKEHQALEKERGQLAKLAASEPMRWRKICDDIRALKKKLESFPQLAKRRTDIIIPETSIALPPEALIEKEPLTVLISAKGWSRVMKSHLNPEQLAQIKYKDGDEQGFVLPCQSTDKLLLLATDGRCFTLSPDKLPSGRGTGEPIRLLIGLGNEAELIGIQIFKAGQALLVASSDGRGFITSHDELIAQTRNGKQILSLPEGETMAVALELSPHDSHIGVIGTHRKMLIFPREQLPVMSKGRGVTLQRYRGAKLADICGLNPAQGLSWPSGGRTRNETNLSPWLGERGQQGRLPPVGFPRTNRFTKV